MGLARLCRPEHGHIGSRADRPIGLHSMPALPGRGPAGADRATNEPRAAEPRRLSSSKNPPVSPRARHVRSFQMWVKGDGSLHTTSAATTAAVGDVLVRDVNCEVPNGRVATEVNNRGTTNSPIPSN